MADMSDLARPNRVVEGPERFLDRRCRVRRVDLVEVDVVGSEAAEAALQRGGEPAARCTPLELRFAHREAELGRDDEVLAPAGQQSAQLLL
jgi:hypothetical protein